MTAQAKEPLQGSFTARELLRLALTPCRERLSGTLWLETSGGARRIIYDNGMPLAVASNAAEEQIETHLLDSEQVSAPQLQRAISYATSKQVTLRGAIEALQLMTTQRFDEQERLMHTTTLFNALSTACTARFEHVRPSEAKAQNPLPLLAACSRVALAWSENEQVTLLRSVAGSSLSARQPDAELAVLLGAPKSACALLQGLTREAKTLVQIGSAARADLVLLLATGLLAPHVSPAAAPVREPSQSWQPVLPAAKERERVTKVSSGNNVRRRVGFAAVLALIGIALLLARQKRPLPEAPVVKAEATPEIPARTETTSVLTAAAEHAKAQAALKPQTPPITPDERARFTASIKRAQLLMKKNKTDAAIEALQAALDIDPSAAEAHRDLAAAYLKRGDETPAIYEYKAYLRLLPSAKDAQDIRKIVDAHDGAKIRH